MADKRITQLLGQTGITVYCIIRREEDSFLLDNADGEFRAAPANMFIPLIEDSTIKGLFELIENREVWEDGKYSVIAYKQTGASPDPDPDKIVGGGLMDILNDEEKSIGDATYANQVIINDNVLDVLTIVETLTPGTGINDHVYTLTVGGLPCADALVYMSTDLVKTNIIHEGRTNALGQVTFSTDLPVGTTVYLWRYKTGVDFVNPDIEEI